MTTILFDPKMFGLTLVASHDAAATYSFNTIAIWRGDTTGRLYAGHDRGCSCPSPFEGVGVLDLTPVRTLADVVKFARARWADLDDVRLDGEASIAEAAVGALLDKLATHPAFASPAQGRRGGRR